MQSLLMLLFVRNLKSGDFAMLWNGVNWRW